MKWKKITIFLFIAAFCISPLTASAQELKTPFIQSIGTIQCDVTIENNEKTDNTNTQAVLEECKNNLQEMKDHILKQEVNMITNPKDEVLASEHSRAEACYSEAVRLYTKMEQEVKSNVYIEGDISIMRQTLPLLKTESNQISSSKENEPTVDTEILISQFKTAYQDCISTNTESDIFYGYYNVEQWRKDVVNAGLAAEGKISYKWGGKATDNTLDGTKGGLDCSGFVMWCYWNGINYYSEDFRSTYNITHNLTEISYEELQPGDIATIFSGGSTYTTDEDGNFTGSMNHAGIYVGKDESGEDIFVHCASGSRRTVVVDNSVPFYRYYRVEKMSENSESE